MEKKKNKQIIISYDTYMQLLDISYRQHISFNDIISNMISVLKEQKENLETTI